MLTFLAHLFSKTWVIGRIDGKRLLAQHEVTVIVLRCCDCRDSYLLQACFISGIKVKDFYFRLNSRFTAFRFELLSYKL